MKFEGIYDVPTGLDRGKMNGSFREVRIRAISAKFRF